MSMNEKQFKAKLATITKSGKTLRENVQSVLIFGFEQAKEHGNLGYLSDVMRICIGVRALPTNAIKDYIKDYVEPIKWAKGPDGVVRFSKDGKNGKLKVTMPTEPWFEHESVRKTQAKQDLHVAQRLKSLLTALDNALKEHKVDDEALAKKASDALHGILPA